MEQSNETLLILETTGQNLVLEEWLIAIGQVSTKPQSRSETNYNFLHTKIHYILGRHIYLMPSKVYMSHNFLLERFSSHPRMEIKLYPKSSICFIQKFITFWGGTYTSYTWTSHAKQASARQGHLGSHLQRAHSITLVDPNCRIKLKMPSMQSIS